MVSDQKANSRDGNVKPGSLTEKREEKQPATEARPKEGLYMINLNYDDLSFLVRCKITKPNILVVISPVHRYDSFLILLTFYKIIILIEVFSW